jgi:hypothetical protein
VQLDTNYGTGFPATTSFTPDLVGPNYGYVINADEIYQISYQLLLTNTSLSGGNEAQKISLVQLPDLLSVPQIPTTATYKSHVLIMCKI